MISGPGAPAAIVDRSAAAAQSAAGPVVSVLRGNVASTGLVSGGARRPILAALVRVLTPWPRAALAASTLGGIHVSIEGAELATWTDAAGDFELQGDFSGSVVVALERDDGIAARVPVMVPRGGTVTLSDIHLDGSASSIAVHFEGVVVDKDCLARLVDVASRFEPEGPAYTIDLTSSAARSASGLPVPCIALREGGEVEIEGTLGADGTIQGARLTPAPRQLAVPELPAVTSPASPDRPSPVPTMELPAVSPTP